MKLRRMLLSATLVGGSVWCLTLVAEANSQEGARSQTSRPNAAAESGPTPRSVSLSGESHLSAGPVSIDDRAERQTG